MRNDSLLEVVRGNLTSHGQAHQTADLHARRYAPRVESVPSVDDSTGTAHYYNLVTDFYEYGWGQSFHFAPRFDGEAVPASLARLEHLLALRLGLAPGVQVLDAGCGVGGPMRAMARLSGASIVGVTISEYQAERGNLLHARAHLGDRCRSVQGDFTRLEFEAGKFDAVYSIEAICHASRRDRVFRELRRVTRSNGRLAGTDWCVTDRYDPTLSRHRRIIRTIEEANGLAPLVSTRDYAKTIAAAGWSQVETRDLADVSPGEVPWYAPLRAGWRTPSELRRTTLGRRMANWAVRALERTGLAPRGSVATSDILNRAADALIEGGEAGIFTPLFFFTARKVNHD